MTRTVHTSLGSAPVVGKHAIDCTQRFKDQLRSLQPKPASVHLLTVEDEYTRTRSVVAVYDTEDPAAREWVNFAEATAPEIWLKLAERRKARVR